jgi:hypothetical protein
MAANCAASCGCPSPPVTEPAPEPASVPCRDKDKTGACGQWAATGECEKNPTYMKLKYARLQCCRRKRPLPSSRRFLFFCFTSFMFDPHARDTRSV